MHTMKRNCLDLGRSAIVRVCVAALFMAWANAQAQQPPLTLKVISADAFNFHTNVTLVMGETDAVLIDVPFTLSQAHRVVAEILESKKNLTHIYITHSHPDHYFGDAVLMQAFPNAELIAVPIVCANIADSIPGRLAAWSDVLGQNGPEYPLVPKAYHESHIELEGKRLEILGPMQGDHTESTVIYIPSLEAIVTGDLVFSGLHMFLGHATPADRKAWRESLAYLKSLEPKIVVAGHKLPGGDDSPASLDYAIEYLAAFEQAVARSKTSAEVITEMRQRFPDAQDVMDDFILTVSAKVATGEMPPIIEASAAR